MNEIEGKKQSVLVIGGGNGWGEKIAKAFEKDNHNVQILEIEDSKSKDYPLNYQKAIDDNDIIFIAVQDNIIDNILKDTRDFLTKDKILLDCASNKLHFKKSLIDIAFSGASVCSTHPMVKPEISSRGHNVIFMPLGGDNSKKAEEVAERVYVKMLGMNSEFLNIELHADYMIIVQMVPHLIQRILIDALGRSLKDKKLKVDKTSRIASANYMLSELGFGRVGSQETKSSAGIIETALKTPFGMKVVGGIISNLGQIISDGDERLKLETLFDEGMTLLDPDEIWRSEMEVSTNTMLTRIGNLRRLSCKIKANDEPQILLKILTIVSIDFKINMTALDSDIDNDDKAAIFEIGIDDSIDGSNINYKELANSLRSINCSLIWPGNLLFNWREVPGKDNKNLLEFLTRKYNINEPETDIFEITNKDNIIKVSGAKNNISLSLSKNKTKVKLEIDDGRNDELFGKMVKGNLNIYEYY